MLALLYLIVMTVLGDSVNRRFYAFTSVAHRLAAAFIIGLLLSSWWTYLSALLFQSTNHPMLFGNLLFFISSIAVIILLRLRPISDSVRSNTNLEVPSTNKWDWILIGIFFLVACWMMFGTFNYSDGKIQIANHQWSDFGSTVAIMQSFAVGQNFPTEYPHWSGDHIRYHFLFYFQAGNLEYLGLNPAYANDVLSVLSLTSMLILVMALGTVVFGSRVVGRIGAILFFFQGTLSFITFYLTQTSLWDALKTIYKMGQFLPSAFPYRGELWGVWSQVVYINQRHLSSSIGILLVVLIFLMTRYRLVPPRVRRVKTVEAEAWADGDEVDRLAEERSLWLRDIDGGDPSPVPTETSSPALEDLAEARETTEIDPPARMEALHRSDPPVELELDGPTVISNETLEVDTAKTGGETAHTITDQVTTDVDIASVTTTEEAQTGSPRVGDPFDVDATPEPEVTDLGSSVSDAPVTDTVVEDKPVEKLRPKKKKKTKPAPKPFDLTAWIADAFQGSLPYVYSGFLLGLLPIWNGAVFTAAFAVLAGLFVLFPLRKKLVFLGIATAIFALPQVLWLRTGLPDQGFSLLHFGFTIDQPTPWNVLEFIGFIFGFKWLLILLAVIVGTALQRKLMLAISGLFVLTFFFQFSSELLANHKFLNVWLVIANLFVAFAIVFLWNLRILKTTIFSRLLTIVLVFLITASGIIDLFPIHNETFGDIPFRDDQLVNWVRENTDPRAIFLTRRVVNHPILMAGRKIFYGLPYYAWGIGYPTARRDALYKQLLESKNPDEVFRILKENNISYVVFDKPLRDGDGDLLKTSNEALFKAYFDVVFDDKENKYDGTTIYAIPDELGPPKPEAQFTPELVVNPLAPVSPFKGGEGAAPGEFQKPRGIAVDAQKNIYVADTSNSRIQKFDQDGKFLFAFGSGGPPESKLDQPNGIAVVDGFIYIVDASNHKLFRFKADGSFDKLWRGPDPSFYGPRDIAVGPGGIIYIVDQGRTRIVRFDPKAETFTSWGTSGNADGQFSDPTGIGMAPNMVIVADTGNNRIQEFTLEGTFIRQWDVPAWEHFTGHYPDVEYDEVSDRIFVSNGKTGEILAFGLDGTPRQGYRPEGPDSLKNPSGLAILDTGKKRNLLILDYEKNKITVMPLELRQAAEVKPAGK
jgi:DNA-binding beta-propeller fold protein YncE